MVSSMALDNDIRNHRAFENLGLWMNNCSKVPSESLITKITEHLYEPKLVSSVSLLKFGGLFVATAIVT